MYIMQMYIKKKIPNIRSYFLAEKNFALLFTEDSRITVEVFYMIHDIYHHFIYEKIGEIIMINEIDIILYFPGIKFIELYQYMLL